MQKKRLVMFMLVAMLLLTSCGTGGSEAAKQSTLEAISAQVRETGTAAASGGGDAFSVAETA
ncbi:MAG TPA: hypothetical protein PLF42_08170, partial [Anaerolineales bacterium]|nr:hypothetical protein [Anaerolineales bacterium]